MTSVGGMIKAAVNAIAIPGLVENRLRDLGSSTPWSMPMGWLAPERRMPDCDSPESWDGSD